MERLSAVFSARMGVVLASAALLAGCVVAPVEGGDYRHDRYKSHSYTRYGHPPPPRVERRPHPPGPDYVWSQGSWVWSGQRYQWRPGKWQYVRPAPPPRVRPGPPPHAQRPGPPPHAQRPGPPPHAKPPPAPPAGKPARPHERPKPPPHQKEPRHKFPVEPSPPPYRDRGPGGA